MNWISISLDRARLQGVLEVRCTKCQSPLELHQPDPGLPERLLGTCQDCHVWYLMDITKGVMVLLPVGELIDGASELRADQQARSSGLLAASLQSVESGAGRPPGLTGANGDR